MSTAKSLFIALLRFSSSSGFSHLKWKPYRRNKLKQHEEAEQSKALFFDMEL
jgi:hypothetical protein